MSSINWNFADPDSLAEFVELDDFKQILQQRMAIQPDHAALLLRDGNLAGVFQGAHIAVGGVFQKLRELIGGSHALRLLVIDLKPFDIQGNLETLSQDKIPLAATVTVQMQATPEKPENFLGMMEGNVSVLTRADVYNRLIPHLQDRVFHASLREQKAETVRGDTALQDEIQAGIMHEAQRIFGDLGLLVRHTALDWALNDAEMAAMQQRQVELEEARLDSLLTQKKRALERENDTTRFVLASELDTEKLKLASDDELRNLILKQELDFQQAKDTGMRVQEFEKLAHEIELLNAERRANYTRQLEGAENEIEKAKLRNQLTAIELETQKLQATQALQLEKLRSEQELDIAAQARKEQLTSLEGLNKVELDAEERRRHMDREDRQSEHAMSMDEKKLAAQAAQDALKAHKDMSAEQILATQAGASPEAARVLAEKMKAEGLADSQEKALLREMVELSKSHQAQTDEQTRFLFERAMQGVVGVSQGAAARVEESRPDMGGQNAAPSGEKTCPNCQVSIPATDKFCRQCGSAQT